MIEELNFEKLKQGAANHSFFFSFSSAGFFSSLFFSFSSSLTVSLISSLGAGSGVLKGAGWKKWTGAITTIPLSGDFTAGVGGSARTGSHSGRSNGKRLGRQPFTEKVTTVLGSKYCDVCTSISVCVTYTCLGPKLNKFHPQEDGFGAGVVARGTGVVAFTLFAPYAGTGLLGWIIGFQACSWFIGTPPGASVCIILQVICLKMAFW